MCFAPGWFINDKDETYQAAWKRFYTSKPRAGEGEGWLHGTKLVLMTSSGRLLSGRVQGRNGMAKGLREVLASYAKLPEVERHPKAVEGEVKPQLAPPEGGLVLTIYDRPLGRDKAGRYRLPAGADLGGFRPEAPQGQRSSLWLKEEECRSLIPENPQRGQTYPMAAKLARRLFLYGLVPQSLWVAAETWKPDSVREEDLRLTVTDFTPKVIQMRMSGSVLLSGPGVLRSWPDEKFIKNVENRYDARLEGVLTYDRAKKKITRWDLAALGDYSGRWYSQNKGWKEATLKDPLPLGFSVELDQTAYDLPAEQRRPRSFMQAYVFQANEAFYWDPDKWLEDWKKRQKK